METPELASQNTFAIHVPRSLAEQIESSAREQHTDVPNFLEKAVRAYRLSTLEQELSALRADSPPTSYTEDDIEAFVDEVRSEMYLERRR